MMGLLLRLGCFCVGILLLADLVVPGRHESAKLVAHRVETEWTWSQSGRQGEYRHQDEHRSYWLDMGGEDPRSCEVNFSAYEGLHDGDAVGIKLSPILKRCVSVAKVNGPLYSNRGLNLGRLIGALVLLAVGLGFVNPRRLWERDGSGRTLGSGL
ncbi:hypothetical protein [Niveibacterium sp. SC-1]|uniref:hypothetical protein n=1 Tax=Niveibacterium sp. SC-1 TaxID=3135646 RepID=UPI00311F3565